MQRSGLLDVQAAPFWLADIFDMHYNRGQSICMAFLMDRRSVQRAPISLESFSEMEAATGRKGADIYGKKECMGEV